MKCSGCAKNLEVGEDYIEIPNHGIYCPKCAETLAQQGITQARQDALEIGDSAVNERINYLRDNLDNVHTRH